MCAGDGCAYAFSVADDAFTFRAKPVHQVANARFVLRIGALQFTHLGVNQGFELDGAGEGAVHAVTHGLHFTAHGLTNGHDALMGEVFRLGKTEGSFRHRLRGKPHFLRAAHHDGKPPEQDHRDDNADEQRNCVRCRHKGTGRANLPERGAVEHLAEKKAAANPKGGEGRNQPIGCVGCAAVEFAHDRTEIPGPVVIGGGERLGSGVFGRRIDRCEVLAVERRFFGFSRLGNGVACLLWRSNAGSRSGRLGTRGVSSRFLGGRRGVFLFAHGDLAVPVLVAVFAREFLGRCRNLRFQVLHGGGDIQVAILQTVCKLQIEGILEFLRKIALGLIFLCYCTRHTAKPQLLSAGASYANLRNLVLRHYAQIEPIVS